MRGLPAICRWHLWALAAESMHAAKTLFASISIWRTPILLFHRHTRIFRNRARQALGSQDDFMIECGRAGI